METWPKTPVDIDLNELCFGCGKNNPIGLKLDFKREGKTARAEFTPTEFYQGWAEIVHGGIICSLLDEAMAYAAMFEGMHCITAKMETRIKRPARVGELLIITSSVTKRSRKLIETKASITLKNGTPVAEGKSSQFVVKSEPEKRQAKGGHEKPKMERSLVLIKPDAMQRGLAGTILARLEKGEMKLVGLKMLHLDEALAKRHYAVHRAKPFFSNLVSYITSAPIIAAVFEGENTIQTIRDKMGSTDPAEAKPGTIRGDFGLDIERNSVHSSDSVETAEEEVKLFFPEEEILSY